MTYNPKLFQRRRPKQARSQATYDSILEAAGQMLEREGSDGLNTNRIAERAGVSVGTLYQYFPDKAAILLATAKRALTGAEGVAAQPKALIAALVRTVEDLMAGAAAAARSGRRRASDPAAPLRPRRNSEPLEQRLLAWLIPIGPIPIPIVARSAVSPLRRRGS